VTQLQRRDFLLDSGAVTALARDRKLLEGYSALLERKFDGRILIPEPVLAEVYTGDPRYDVVVDRLINEIAAKQIGTKHNVFVPLTAATAIRAGALRYKALKSEEDIEVVDAFVVAIAQYLSDRSPITILTGDVKDITALVAETGRKNIAVDRAG
jgi:hypothetical protein